MSSEKLVSVDIRDGIAYICFDVKGEKVNTLSPAMNERMEEILEGLKREKSKLDGAVLYSAKKNNFIAGFDINELKNFGSDPKGLDALVSRGHEMMGQFESLGIPFVAAIDGSCLGGGLEVALACQGRVATNNPKTKLGLPEVMLGVIPGAGGTQRLPRLIDLQFALTMILQGKQVGAKKAKKLGLVDDVVHHGILLDVAADLARKLKKSGAKNDKSVVKLGELRKDPAGQALKIVASSPARGVIFDKAREGVMKATKGKYPAPLKAIDVIEKGLADGFDAGLKAERAAFVELVSGDVAQNLVNLFFMKNEADKDPHVSKNVKARDVEKIGVLGAGLMGAGIAQVCAFKGYNIRMKDRDMAGVGWGVNYCKELFDKAVKYKKMSEPEADVAFGRISGTTTYDGIGNCDLVIEAVFEDLALKQKILADVEAVANRNLIFASNTSTIPIHKIAENSKNKGNVLGMHYFSPVHKMPLLEIIKTKDTTQTAVATALAVGRKTGKTCIVVNDGPGFFTSRVIGAYINEAGWILQEGGAIDHIDRAMKDFGFPVGPMKLVDEVGLDVANKAAGILKGAFEERWDQPTALVAIAEDGRKGRKNEKGLYDYAGESKGKAVDESVYDLIPGGRNRKNLDAEVVKARCWLAMLNECAYCLQEEIAEKPRDIDIGVIFGLGFPPFRGGVLRHADKVGLTKVRREMESLADKFGERLAPAQIIVDLEKKGVGFYG